MIPRPARFTEHIYAIPSTTEKIYRATYADFYSGRQSRPRILRAICTPDIPGTKRRQSGGRAGTYPYRATILRPSTSIRCRRAFFGEKGVVETVGKSCGKNLGASAVDIVAKFRPVSFVAARARPDAYRSGGQRRNRVSRLPRAEPSRAEQSEAENRVGRQRIHTVGGERMCPSRVHPTHTYDALRYVVDLPTTLRLAMPGPRLCRG